MHDTPTRGPAATLAGATAAETLVDGYRRLLADAESSLAEYRARGMHEAAGSQLYAVHALQRAIDSATAAVGAVAPSTPPSPAAPRATRRRRVAAPSPTAPPRLELVKPDGSRGASRPLPSPVYWRVARPWPAQHLEPGDVLVLHPDGAVAFVRHGLRFDLGQLFTAGVIVRAEPVGSA